MEVLPSVWVRRTSFRLNQSNIPSGRIQVASAIYSFIFVLFFYKNEKNDCLVCHIHTLLQVSHFALGNLHNY